MTSTEIVQLAQAIGIVACGGKLAWIKLKSSKNTMLILCGAHLLFAVSFFMLGLVNGAVFSVISAARILWLQFPQNSRRKTFSSYVWAEALVAVFMCSIIISYSMPQNDWIEIIPLVGVLLDLFATICKNNSLSRILRLVGSVFWLAYGILGFAIGAIISEVINVIFYIKAVLKGGY